MSLSQKRNDLLLRGLNLSTIADLDIDVTQSSSTDDPLHRARKRHDHDIILIDALRAQTFRSQNSGDSEWNIFDPQNLSDWVVVTVNL